MIPFSGFQILVLRKLQTIYDLIVSSPPGSTTWGTITGLLANQTDLQNALNAKQDTLVSGTNIKTINTNSILGSGDLTITGGIPKGTAAGTDTYTTTITGVTAYNDGDAYLIRFTNGNTTTATLNINSIGVVTLYRNNDGPIVPGDILDGAEMLCIYNSTTPSFQCIGTSPNTLLSYVTNDDTVTITKGQPVYASGGVGDRLKVKLAYNTGDSTSAQTIGLVFSTSIAAGQKGIIIMQGLLTGLSILPTSTWADSDPVYLGPTAGSITPIKQYAPNHLVYLGFVTTASNGSAGRLYVRVQNGYELDELHDVYAQTPSNNDGLFFNTSTSLWESKQIKTINGDSIVGSGNELIFNSDRAKYGYEYFNDFLLTLVASGASDATGLVSFFSGTGASLVVNPIPSVRAANQQGFIQFNTGTVATGYAGVYGTTVANNFLMLGGGAMTYITSVFIPTLSTSVERFRVTIGYGTTATSVAETNGVFFTYDEGGTQNGTAASPYWQCVTVAGGVRTLITTTVLASTTAWQKLTIQINDAATSVEFYIDNVLVATHTTNIPSGTSQLVTPKLQIVKTAGTTTRGYYSDYIGYRQTYTTAKL